MKTHLPNLRFLLALIAVASFFSIPARANYQNFPDVKSGSDICVQELRWPYWNGGFYNTWMMQSFTSSDGVSGSFYSGVPLPAAGTPGPAKAGINYSFWSLSNPLNPTDTISSKYSSPTTFPKQTIAEGTILEDPGTWYFWQTNTWYRVVFRAWQPADGTPHKGYAGEWIRDSAAGIWYHIATVQTPFAVTGISGWGGFQEDASGSTSPQRTDYRRLYYHYNGVWNSATNYHDSNQEGITTTTYMVDNAGLIETNSAVYLETCNNNTNYYLTSVTNDSSGIVTNQGAGPNYVISQPLTPTFLDPILVTNYSGTLTGGQLLVQWQMLNTSSPQFACQIKVYTNSSYTGTVVASFYDNDPETRQKLLTIPAGITPYPQLTIIDVFNQTNAPVSVTPTNAILLAATNVTGVVGGLNFAYYESASNFQIYTSGTNWSAMPNFGTMTPALQGAVSGLDLTPRRRRDGYAFNYNGFLNVASSGLYTFTLNSDAGSKLYVDGQLVVNNDGQHSPADLSGWVGLQAGYHTLNVQYFCDTQPFGGYYYDSLGLSYEGPGITKTVVPVTALSRVPGASEPSLTLTSPANGATVSGAGVPLSASVTTNGNTINSVWFYNGNNFWAQDTSAPYTNNSFFWDSNNNPLRARLYYNGTNIIDSAVNLVNTTNQTLTPWQFGQIFFHDYPSGASIQSGTYSLIGDGVDLLTRQVSGDCTIIAHLAGLPSTAAAPDGSVAESGWQAGIILRGTTNLVQGFPWGHTGSAPFVAVFGQVGGGTYYQDEDMVNGGGGFSRGAGSGNWYKLVRTGGTNFTSFVSANGSTWTQVGNTNLTDFPATIYVGMFTYAEPDGNLSVPWAKFDNVSITGNILGPPTVSMTPAAGTAYAGQTTTLTALPGGNAPFYYQWQLNGVILAGATNAALTLTNVQPANSGIYNVVLTNANGTASAGGTLTVLTPVPASSAIMSNNPIGYWRLNETAGPTANDALGNFNGAGQGGTLFGVPGVTNAPFTGFEPGNLGAQFGGDSSPSDIAIPAFNVTTTNFAITGWVKCNGTQDSWSGLIFGRNTAAEGLMVVNNGGNELRYSWNDNGNDYNASTGLKLPAGQWAFVALTITPTQAIVYFATNATLQAWTNTTANAGQTFNGNFYLGCDPSSLLSGSRQFAGSLDEIAIYNRTLTGSQIGQIFVASQTALPAVTLTAPANGANFGGLATVNLTAGVVTNGHAINNVQFYSGATLLGISSNAPYSLVWSNVAVGNYTVLAQAAYDATNVQSSAPAFVTVNPLPTAPQNLTVAATASNQISLAWTAGTNATGYIVSRNGTVVATVASVGWSDIGLAASTTYSYSVATTNLWGSSASSVTNSATTLASGNALAWDAGGLTAGAQDGSDTWGSSVTNWWSGSAIAAWADGNIASFGVGTPGSYTVTIANDVTPAGVVFAAVNGAYTLAGGGGGINLSGATAFNCTVDGAVSAVIKGPGSLVKTGPGTLTLSGANTFSGGTTLSNGTLQLVTGSVLPGNVANYGALLVNRSDTVNFGGVISGNGSLTMQGGTLSITNANTFSGGSSVNGGTLSLGNGASASENVNGLGTGMVTVNAGGTLRLDNSGGATTFNIPSAITLNGGTILSIDNYEHLTGPVTVAANGGTLSQYYDSKSLWLDGKLTGSGTLTINNPNTSSYQPYAGVHFSNPANTYSGTINITANAATIDNTYALSNATLNVTGAGSSGPIIWGSGVTSIVLGGLSGTYNLANGGNALAVGNNNSSTTYSGILSGAGSLTKLGTGTFTLSGANSYTGATTVSNGLLLVNGSLAGGVVVGTNGVLGGGGVISGAVTNRGTLTAGINGIGTLTINNKLILAGGSTTLLKLSKNGGVLTNDLVFISGALTNGGTLVVTNIGNNVLAAGDSFKLFQAGAYAGGFTNYILPALTNGLSWYTGMVATNGALAVVVSSFMLTYLSNTNGTISGTATQVVNYAASGSTVTAVAGIGCHFMNWSDGLAASSRTDGNVTSNLTVTANFAVNTYTLAYLAGANGTVSGVTNQTVNYGGSGTMVSAVAGSGYAFSSWSDGLMAGSRTDANVTGNLTVTANFVAVSVAPPVITAMSLAADKTSFTLGGQGAANAVYVLVVATNLPPVWVPVLTNSADAGGAFSFTDWQVTNSTQRFYRVQAQP